MKGKGSWRTIALWRVQNRNATFYSHLSGTMWKINPSLYIHGDYYRDKDQANLMFMDNFSTKYLYICLEKIYLWVLFVDWIWNVKMLFTKNLIFKDMKTCVFCLNLNILFFIYIYVKLRNKLWRLWIFVCTYMVKYIYIHCI